MKTCKRIGIFLLLGVLLVGLGFSGCAPMEQTQASTSEPEPNPNAIAFLDLPGVNMDNINKISIYYGSADNRELIQTLESAKAITELRTAFEQLRFVKIEKFADTTSSAGVYYTEEYTDAIQNIDTAYCIHLQLMDDTQWNVFVGTNKLVYYATPQGNVYISGGETDYLRTIGLGRVLNRSYIEGCTYAGITRSLLDSQIHMLLGEENVITFFDMFFSGLELTDDNERIAEVRKSGYVGTLFQPFQICFTCAENNFLLISVYENGAIIVDYKDYEFASVQDNAVDKQAIEQWLKEHDAL